MAGPIVAALVGALEGAVVVGGVSGLLAAMTRPGVPKTRSSNTKLLSRPEKAAISATAAV